MAQNGDQENIVYLFGAGATHAELINLYPKDFADETFLGNNSLLLSQVSKRVCGNVRNARNISSKIRGLISPAGLSNVELFISLVEKNIKLETDRIAVISRLKTQIEQDITERLRTFRHKRFYLHKSLLEFHKRNKQEKLSGIISLNYPPLDTIKRNMELLSQFERPENAKVMEEFQKYVLQASVEPSSIKRRDDFLKIAFAYYRKPSTKGRIIRS